MTTAKIPNLIAMAFALLVSCCALSSCTSDAPGKTVTILQTVDHYLLSFNIKQVEIRPSIGDRTAHDGSTFAIVYYSLKNVGNDTVSGLDDQMAIMTGDNTVFREDETAEIAFQSTHETKALRGLNELQPGVTQEFIGAFELPEKQLHSDAMLVVPANSFGTKIALLGKTAPATVETQLQPRPGEQATKTEAEPVQAHTTDVHQDKQADVTHESAEPVKDTSKIISNAHAAAPTSNTVDGGPNAAALIDQALSAQQTGESIEAALMSLSKLSKPDSGNHVEAAQLNKTGLAALRTKDYAQAVTMFKAAAKSDPSDSIYFSNLGNAEMHNGDLDAAQNDLHISIAVAPRRQTAWDDLGEVFAKKGEKDKAVACFMIGHKLSKGETVGYLQSLQQMTILLCAKQAH